MSLCELVHVSANIQIMGSKILPEIYRKAKKVVSSGVLKDNF